jgi:hypothetical protein
LPSGLRWLSVVLACAISFALASCDLNPQPEVPGVDETSAGGFVGVGGEGGEGGATASVPGPDDHRHPGGNDDPGFDQNSKNSGNLEDPSDERERPAPPPPPADQRPVADAGTDSQPPIVTM